MIVNQKIASVADQQTIQMMGHKLINDLERVQIYNSTSAQSAISITVSLQDGESQELETVRTSVGVEGSGIEVDKSTQKTENTDKWIEVVRKSPPSSPTFAKKHCKSWDYSSYKLL